LRSRVYLIGNIFRQNNPFRAYVIREIEQKNSIDAIESFDEAGRDFYAELEKRVNAKEIIYIVTNKKSFNLVSKLLCTLTDDRLLLKEQMLIPSKCETYQEQSFLLHVNHAVINVVEAQESESLAQLLMDKSTKVQTLHFFEHNIKEVIEQLMPLAKQFDVELTFSQKVERWIEVNVKCNTYGSIDKFMSITKDRYHEYVIISDDLVQQIINTLIQTKQKITLAESCTGGLLAYYFTQHAGVSAVFEGSLVTYSNILKENWLAVENATLVAHGAVSEAVVDEMSEGALSIANADYALAVSGVAGPDGGSKEKPVGTVVIGFRSKHGYKTETYHFQGDRNYVQEQSALTALKMLVLGDKKVFFKN